MLGGGGHFFYEAQPLCYATSENAFEHFARNDDGNGMLRGQLTRAIKKRLAKQDAQYQERWDKVWADELCLRFKRAEFDDFWVWNKAFYDAEIEELEHIAKLVGTEVKR